MATEMNRLTISIPPEMEKEITKMRMTKKFCKASYSEIVRYLINKGLEEKKHQQSN